MSNRKCGWKIKTLFFAFQVNTTPQSTQTGRGRLPISSWACCNSRCFSHLPPRAFWAPSSVENAGATTFPIWVRGENKFRCLRATKKNSPPGLCFSTISSCSETLQSKPMRGGDKEQENKNDRRGSVSVTWNGGTVEHFPREAGNGRLIPSSAIEEWLTATDKVAAEIFCVKQETLKKNRQLIHAKCYFGWGDYGTKNDDKM